MSFVVRSQETLCLCIIGLIWFACMHFSVTPSLSLSPFLYRLRLNSTTREPSTNPRILGAETVVAMRALRARILNWTKRARGNDRVSAAGEPNGFQC